jgi:hypothetical protein
MTAPGAEPIPAISEQDATGDVASQFADLRATLRLPFVNLIWRHLATVPGGLAWVWTLTKPLYVSGELDRISKETAAHVAFPSLAPLPDFVLESAAISRNDRQMIAAMIESYNQANGVNLLALTVAVSVLRDGLPATTAQSVATSRPALSTSALPPLPGLSELPPHVVALVHRLDQFGRLGPSQAIASLYRHLAHWPAFLALAYTALAPFDHRGELAEAQQHVIASSREPCIGLARLVNPNLPALSPESKAAVLRALDEFTRLMIGRMVVMGKAMRLLIG